MATLKEVLDTKPSIQEIGVIAITVLFVIIGILLYQQDRILLSIGAFLIGIGAFGWWAQVIYEETHQ